MDIAKDNENTFKLHKFFVLLLALVIGLMTLTIPVHQAEAYTLSQIEMGSRKTSQNLSGATTYDYLLNGTTSKGFLPDIKNLSKYGYKNKGWNIKSPMRNQTVGGGGREFHHSVFPSGTYFHEKDGVNYLRITGNAVLLNYFHHTDKNHRVAILTREDKKSGSVKLWEADLYDLTSSASYDYGYGTIDGKTDWRAGVSQPDHGIVPVHVTNDPYPRVASKAAGKGASKYFDSGYSSLFGHAPFNVDQVAKLCGLGSVGNRLVDTWGANWTMEKHGCTYIYDYSGWVVDIPVNAIVSDGSTKHDYDFNILMTVTTPNGHEERVVGQELHVPGIGKNSTTVFDTFEGYEGKLELSPSDLGRVNYQPDSAALRNFKRTSNFTANHYAKDTNITPPSSQKATDTYSFSASSSKPIMLGWGNNRFGSGTWNEIHKNKNTADFTEVKGNGRGELWVGWSMPSMSKHKLYTSTSLAYNSMPTATMNYSPQEKFKPLIIRHRIVEDDNYKNPGKIFKQEELAIKKSKYGTTVKPLTGTSLTSLGKNMKYTGYGRLGADPTTPVKSIGTGGYWISNDDLLSSKYNGYNRYEIDLYYSGTPTDDPQDKNKLTYTVTHKDKDTGKDIANTGYKGSLKPGQSQTVFRERPYGYVYANEYKVDGGSAKSGTSYTITHDSDEARTVNVVFYYNKREMGYEIEHRNIETENKIEHNTNGKINMNQSYVAEPLKGNKLPEGYTYASRYSVDGGSKQTGNSYTVKYDDEKDKVKVTFWYDWNEPEETTKRFQGDNSDPKPVDAYINAGIETKRDDEGNVISTAIQAHTSAILDTYEAPIAIVPVKNTISIRGTDGSVESNQSENRNYRVYNDKYLDSVRVDNRIGGSKDANGNQPTKIYLHADATSHVNIQQSLGRMENSIDTQEEALGLSDATIGVNEDRDYVGRWVDSQKLNMKSWTPTVANEYLTSRVKSENDVNAVEDVVSTFEIEVYNRMKHHYTPVKGSDGLEYYQYRGTDLLPGYYKYDNNGKRVGGLQDKEVTQSSYLDITDMGVQEYIDSEGFNVGAGQVAPAQFLVASEQFDDGGETHDGYVSESVPSNGSADPVVDTSDEGTGRPTISEELPRVNYYEELGYIPFHTESEVLTQQAIPVGGKVTYVNPYDYFVFPTVQGLSAMEESGKLTAKVKENVQRFEDEYDSEIIFTPEHSGLYMSEVDEYDSYIESLEEVTSANKTYVENQLKADKQYAPDKAETTRSYDNYHNLIKNSTSRYTPVETVQSTNSLSYRLPVAYVHNLRELLLEDAVAVGQDTGYPVVSNPSTIVQDYKERYKEDNGVEPSKTDKLVTTNKGSIYLLPLQKKGQRLDDIYRTRMFVNSIGISQINLVDDNELTIDKYLYGRGDNVIYSGEREEVEVGSEFNSDQKVEQEAKPETTGQVNGTRTNNNSKVNDKVLGNE